MFLLWIKGDNFSILKSELEIKEVRFSDLFPVALSGLDYNQNVTDVEYLTATIDFRYKLYEMVTIE